MALLQGIEFDLCVAWHRDVPFFIPVLEITNDLYLAPQ
jgi:hypothetical protein